MIKLPKNNDITESKAQMKFEYYFLNNLLREEALKHLDSGMEKFHLSSLFDQVIITNEAS